MPLIKIKQQESLAYENVSRSQETPADRPHIDTIIVNYSAGELVVDSLASLLKSYEDEARGRIYIVDNASPNGDAVVLRKYIEREGLSDRIELVAEKTNLGFAKGNNVALRQIFASNSPPQYVFLLNPDAYVKKGALARLATFLEETPSAAIAGARLEGPEGDPQISAFNFISPATEAIAAAGLTPLWRFFPGTRVAPPQRDKTYRADWVCGAAVMIRRTVFEQIGLFDAAYFLYYEETDFMLAAKRAALETWYVHDAHAVHLVGQSSNVKTGRTAENATPSYVFDSRAYYFKKNFGGAGLAAAEIGFVLGSLFYAATRGLTGRSQRSALLDIRHFLAARRARLARRRSSGAMPR
ncbi:MAG: glycosyltransferase family 2 protein [Pseudomonadota bacterium]